MSFFSLSDDQVSPTRRRIIHIAGAPGSGKTSIGKHIASCRSSWIVKDTDEFIKHHTEEGKRLLALENAPDEEYRAEWKRIFTRQFAKFYAEIEAAEKRQKPKEPWTILFVGMLDHWALPGDDPFPVPRVTEKYFLDVPLHELLRRYYLRLGKNDDYYWERVASGEFVIDSSETITRQQAHYDKWADANDYTRKTNEDLLTLLLQKQSLS